MRRTPSRKSRALVKVALACGGLAFALACGGPKYPSCENDEHCNSDGHQGVCVNGKCVSCRDDSGCGAGKECRAGTCEAKREPNESKVVSRPPPRECGDDMPCPQGQRCENGHCVLPPQGGPGCREFPAPKFDFEGAELRGDAADVLRRLAECITTGSLKGSNVLLTGHCDPRGEDEFNMTLGAQRAETVRTFLTGLGVPANKIAVSSRGKLDAHGSDETSWAQDRRVDIEVR